MPSAFAPRPLPVGLVQLAASEDRSENRRQALEAVREAAGRGARLVLLPELFSSRYFPAEERLEPFEWAAPLSEHPDLTPLCELAAERSLVVVASVFERLGPHFFNTAVAIDADGSVAGVYRKTHLPDGPGYEEKFFFRPGSRAPRPIPTRVGRLGLAICWDQWFPEVARLLVLRGAEILLYPTAIGSEPSDPQEDSEGPWGRALAGHAVCNAVPLAAANRTGQEGALRFYGASRLLDARGEPVLRMGRDQRGVAVGVVDLGAAARRRADWGFFRDRRPDLYGPLSEGPEEGEPVSRP